MESAAQTSQQNLTIPWDRFWCLLGGPIACGATGRGFLSDPENESWLHSNSVIPIEEILPRIGPLILCGEPGMGKTTEFEKLRLSIHSEYPNGHCLIALSFRQQIADMADFRRLTVESPKWAAWRGSEGIITLMIDGVDEGLLRISNFVGFLTGLLKEEPLERLRLILTCRSAEWPQAMGNDLIELWYQTKPENKPVYELCPLRRKDAEMAAHYRGCDSQAFMKELWKMHVEGLATRPVTLFFLIDEFSGTGAFPITHRELYEHGIQKLADEIDPKRLEILRAHSKTTLRASLDDRLTAARHVAALLLCCGKSAIRQDEGFVGQSDKSLLKLSECTSSTPSVSLLALGEVVESALFTSIGEEKYGFAHQTFAECLAAQHIARLPLIQVRKLLLRRDTEGEHVIPQLAELAAWTAGYHSEFCAHLLSVDPTALLRSDVAPMSDDLKAKLVAAILHGADDGTVLDPYELYEFFFGLGHPGLAAQLRPYIVDKKRHYIARRIAFQIIERCRPDGLSDELLRIVYDAGDSLRENAAEALCEVMPEHRLSELEPLASGEVGEDPKNEIRGAALRRLIPFHWKIRDALKCFVPRSRNNLYGSYHMLLSHELPTHLECADVAPGLDWLRTQTGYLSTASSRKNLAIKMIAMALENLQEPGIRDALIAFWLELYDKYQIHSLDQHEEIKDIFANRPALKRQFFAELVDQWDKDQGRNLSQLFGDVISFDDPADFEWILDQMPAAKKDNRQIWAAVATDLAQWNPKIVTPSWDKLLLRIEEVPELKSRFEWLHAMNLDDPEVRSIRTKWLKRKREQEQFKQRWRRKVSDPAASRTEALKLAETDEPEAWFELWRSLLLKESDSDLRYWNPNVATYPGWELLNAEGKDRARRSARLFLVHHSEVAKEWTPEHYFMWAGVAAVWLLRESVLNDTELRVAISESWVEHCTLRNCPDEEICEVLFAFIYELNPEAAVEALFRSADIDAPARHLMALRQAAKCWSPHLSESTWQYLSNRNDPRVISSGIQEWSKYDKPAATRFAINYLNSCASKDGFYSTGLRDALVGCLKANVEATIDLVMQVSVKDPYLGRSVWREALYERVPHGEKIANDMDERQIANLCIELHKLFPSSEYSENHEAGVVTKTQAVIFTRGRLPGVLTSRGTDEACIQLQRMMTELPTEAANLQWSYQQALLNKRRNSWSTPTPGWVSRLIESAETRLIQCEQDLLELLIESLKGYQRKLTNRMLPAVEELWKWNGSANRRTDFTPKDEEALSGSIARWLFEDIGPNAGTVVNCEVQPKRGSRTDIQVEAVSRFPGADFERLTVVIEVKGCWHPDVCDGMHTQLVDGYLKDLGLTTGLYLVGWFVCDRWKTAKNHIKMSNLEDARKWLEQELTKYDGKSNPEIVQGVVLDCAWPLGSPSD